MKSKILIPFALMLLLASLFVNAAEVITITAPASNEDLTIGSNYNLTGTIAVTGADSKLNCSLYDRLRNEAYPTTAISMIPDYSNMSDTNATYGFWGLFEVPEELGKHFMRVECLNSTTSHHNSSDVPVNYRRFAASEVSESIIDNVIGVFAALFGFVSLIGIVVLFVWLKKRR